MPNRIGSPLAGAGDPGGGTFLGPVVGAVLPGTFDGADGFVLPCWPTAVDPPFAGVDPPEAGDPAAAGDDRVRPGAGVLPVELAAVSVLTASATGEVVVASSVVGACADAAAGWAWLWRNAASSAGETRVPHAPVTAITIVILTTATRRLVLRPIVAPPGLILQFTVP